MAYEPKTWERGEVISADALNHIEQGVAEASEGGGTEPLIVNVTENDGNYYMDKTFGEIRVAFLSGRTVLVLEPNQDGSESPNESLNGGMVTSLDYLVNTEFESALGTVNCYQAFSVVMNEAPYTLEALDAQYPFYN